MYAARVADRIGGPAQADPLPRRSIRKERAAGSHRQVFWMIDIFAIALAILAFWTIAAAVL